MDNVVATFPKNSREQVRVILTEFHGREIINIRVFWSSDGINWNPSTKGLAIGVEKLPILLASLHQAAEILGQDAPEPVEEEDALLTTQEKAALCEELGMDMEQIDNFLSE
jgi:Transcriptional Coactivator p15 (PC4)